MRRSLALMLLAVVAAACISSPLAGELRTWKDSSGKFQVEAEFVGFKDGKVTLRKAGGESLTIPSSRLSPDDQKFVREELKRRKADSQNAKADQAGDRDGAGEFTAAATPAAAMGKSDWPQWRGPQRDGVSPERNLLQNWPEGGPKLAWQTRGLGQGFSSVAISQGRIFTMGQKDGQEQLVALSEEDGQELWRLSVGNSDHSNCTPTVDGDLVFAVGLGGDLVCAEAATGKELWRKNYAADFGGRMMSGWGFSESPLVDGDALICTPGGDRAMIAALDKRSGKVLWTTPMTPGGDRGSDGAGYSSVVISQGAGVKQYVQLVGRGVISVAAKDGRPLWQYPRVANGTANVPTPIVIDDYVFCSSGYDDGGTALLKLSGSGGKVNVSEVWYKPSRDLQNHHGGMVRIGDYVYMGHGHNNGFPVCVEWKSGKIVWGPSRGVGSGSAAIAYADGRLYFRYQDAQMALIEATPEEYRLAGEFRIASRNGESWPHPAIANGKLYLRDQDELHCYDIAAAR